jgi:thioester reductase-like protein
MKLSKLVTTAAMAVVLSAGAAPSYTREMSNMPAAAIHTAVGSMLGQVQDQLAQVGRHLVVEAERGSFYSPDADTNFRAAQTAMQNGRYDQVVADLNRVQMRLESAPYWDASDRRPW